MRRFLALIDIHSGDDLMNNVLKSSNEMGQLPTGMTPNTDESPVVEFNGPKCLYQFTTDV
jgi:hypothetical protein